MGLVHLKSRKIKQKNQTSLPQLWKNLLLMPTLNNLTIHIQRWNTDTGKNVRKHSQLWILSHSQGKPSSYFVTLQSTACSSPLNACLTSHGSICKVPASVVYVSCPCSFICGSKHNIKMRQGCQGTHGHTETSHFGLAITQHRLLYPARSCSELSKMLRLADIPHTPQLLPHLLQCKPSRNNDSKFLCHFCIIQAFLHSVSSGSKVIEFALLQ